MKFYPCVFSYLLIFCFNCLGQQLAQSLSISAETVEPDRENAFSPTQKAHLEETSQKLAAQCEEISSQIGKGDFDHLPEKFTHLQSPGGTKHTRQEFWKEVNKAYKAADDIRLGDLFNCFFGPDQLKISLLLMRAIEERKRKEQEKVTVISPHHVLLQHFEDRKKKLKEEGN